MSSANPRSERVESFISELDGTTSPYSVDRPRFESQIVTDRLMGAPLL